MMPQLLCHLFGDYVLQNQWMANEKVKRWDAAIIHATFYMLPFLLLRPSWLAVLVMWSTHAVIDRYRLTSWWCAVWGIGQPSSIVTAWHAGRDQILTVEESLSRLDAEHPPAPVYIRAWLYIIVDNTFHLTINYLCLEYLT